MYIFWGRHMPENDALEVCNPAKRSFEKGLPLPLETGGIMHT